MKSSKGKERRNRPEPSRARAWLRPVLLVLAAAAIACLIVWLFTRDDPRGLLQQGEALLERDPRQAGELLERAVTASGGDYPEAQVLLCEALARQARWIEALGCLSLIKDKSGCDAEKLLMLAREAYEAGELTLAEHALDAAEEAGGPKAEVLKTAILVRLAQRRDDEALDACRRLARIAPGDAFAPAVEARLLRRRAEILPALDAYRAAVERSTNHEEKTTLRRELVELLIQKRDAAEARGELDLLLRETGETNDSALLRAHVLRLEGRGDEALEQAEAHLGRNPNDANGLNLRGIIWFDLGEYGKASGDLKRVVELNPYQKEAHYKLGQALLRLKRPDEANEHLEISARLTAQTQEILTLTKEAARDPRNELLRRRLAELYEAVGMSRQAEAQRRANPAPLRKP